MLVEQFDQLGEVCQRAGQAVDLVDDDDVDLPATNILKQSLQGRAIGIATGEAAIVILGSNQRPAGVRLASDIGLRGIILGIQGIEVLFQPLVGGDAGIDRTSHRLDCLGVQDRASFDDLSRRPKNRGPFQRVPVMARAIFDRLG